MKTSDLARPELHFSLSFLQTIKRVAISWSHQYQDSVVCCPTVKNQHYFTALRRKDVCIAWCQRCIWHGLGHGTKPAGMMLNSCARRNMPKWHSLIYSSNWEHFNCQIIPREGAGEGFGWHRPNSCQEAFWLFISTDKCVPVPENINGKLKVTCIDTTMTHK